MKTMIAKIACMAIAGMLYAAGSNAQNPNSVLELMKAFSDNSGQPGSDAEEAASSTLKLRITVLEDSSVLKDASVKIYQKGKLLTESNNSSMKMKFKTGSYYTIEVSKPGYVTKSIVVSTVFPIDTKKNSNRTYRHTVSISLHQRATASFLSSRANSKHANAINSTPYSGIIYYVQDKDNFFGFFLDKELQDEKAFTSEIETWQESMCVKQ